MKRIKIYLYIAFIILLAGVLIFNKMAIYGLIVLAVGALLYILWQQILRNKEDTIQSLRSKLETNQSEMNNIKEELNELRNRKLKISDIKSILDLGLMEVNTNFTRTWNKQFTHNKHEVHFIGALRVNIIAKFGIDLQELRFKYIKDLNELHVANVNPKFLSFSDLDYSWEIAELLEYKKPYLGSNHWKKTEKLQHLGQSVKEELQNRIHQEVKNGPEELEWMLIPLQKQIKNTIHLLLGSNERKIIMVNEYDDTFLPPESIPEALADTAPDNNTSMIEKFNNY